MNNASGSSARRVAAPDQAERERALDAGRCVLVQAPAGSGKTDLLTRRFLRLLAEVDEPGQVVAITFTRAAAAEMRHRILGELEKAAARDELQIQADPFSMEALAGRALARSRAAGWNLIELPAQLRISTIDSFCRDLALQQPLLSGLGGGLEIGESPKDLYRRAARRTLERLDDGDAELREAIAALLLWRDNGWQEMEEQLVEMLDKRDRWMHEFVVSPQADWDGLREQLETPFRNAIRDALASLDALMNRVPHARAEIHALARFACAQTNGKLHRELAEMAEFPAGLFDGAEALEEAQAALGCVARLLLTGDGFRARVDVRHGFPSDRKNEKKRLLDLIEDLRDVPGLEAALVEVSELPSARYTDDEWRIVRACFLLLRRAAAELQVVFAEAARVDFVEVAQIAEGVLRGENGIPGEGALAAANGIRHLLVDEFQDTSRRQHRLLARLIGAWEERTGRTCFVVGDPMQSIYFFRDADAELFPRVARAGLDIPGEQALEFDLVRLSANFRTAHALVKTLNGFFTEVFALNDGSGVRFSMAEAARAEAAAGAEAAPEMDLHLEFMPAVRHGSAGGDAQREKDRVAAEREWAREIQNAGIVDLVRAHLGRIEKARAEGKKYRVAVLGRTGRAIASVAEALREAGIPFRAVDLEPLKKRPEVLDALALARALVNPQDREAWMGVLRAPWCGLSLVDLHRLVSGDDAETMRRAVPELMAERTHLLSEDGQAAVERMQRAVQRVPALRAARPAAALGTWLEQAWLALGGAACVDATARENLDLLWSCLDGLPQGELDLHGSALDTALEDLKALPDRGVGSECGVQLMTIHKSKGLEFEVVIVPDLQARAAHTRGKLLSWLERGLERGMESGAAEPEEPTEFLIAPMPTKGAAGGAAKNWVDRVYKARESQEMRRLLYVAATRAREELHLFARPEYKEERDGARKLTEPGNSLLATAWPAVEAEVQERFDAWNAPRDAEVEAIAAVAELEARQHTAEHFAMVQRLPAAYRNPDAATAGADMAGADMAGHGPETDVTGMRQLYERHEGGIESRVLGVGVHALMQQMAQLRETLEWDGVRRGLRGWMPRVAAQIRAAGMDATRAERMASRAVELALGAGEDAVGRWILSPHTDAESEARWAGVVEGRLRTVQVDRVFRAGAEPLEEDGDVWWIIDYKTAGEDGAEAKTLPELRERFRGQVEAYARVLRNLRGADARIHGGLYYPRMPGFDWWEIGG